MGAIDIATNLCLAKDFVFIWWLILDFKESSTCFVDFYSIWVFFPLKFNIN
jgi:hypothetical protein